MKIQYILVPLGIIAAFVFIAVFLMIRAVDGFAIAWKSENNEPRRPGALLYAALGDSAAQGLGAVTQHNGYVGLIQADIKQKGHDIQIINLSKSGAKIQDVIKDQLPELATLKPDLITIEIGANDIADYNAARFETDMDQLMSQLPKSTLISDLPYFGGRTQLPGFGGGKPEQRVLEANQIMRRLAAKHGFELVELHAETQARNRFIWSYAVDYFHPNDLGYRAWADAFIKRISF
jgi:acyl-CoA thioesterase-1